MAREKGMGNLQLEKKLRGQTPPTAIQFSLFR